MKVDDPCQLAHLPIEESCVVQAGPGSGKTWLLVERIKFLQSHNLRPHANFACITYTNAAAEEIAERLPPESIPEFLGTIHSFLLRYILYPYGHFLDELNGGFDLVTEGYAKKYMDWMVKNNHLSREKSRVSEVLKAFESIGYNSKGELQDRKGKLQPSEMKAFVERRLSKGQISQQDVLWFSLCIVTTPAYRHILDALSCRFASVLVDEFQDTTVIQYAILDNLHKFGQTSLFLVGDPSQSIFSFAGADIETFEECSTKYPSYELPNNWRSTKNIVNFLNQFVPIKKELEAKADWKELGIPIYLVVGRVDNSSRIQRFRELMQQHESDLSNKDTIADYFILARGIKLVNELSRLDKGEVDGEGIDELLPTLEGKHPQLHTIMKSLMQACKYKHMGDFKNAFIKLDMALSRLILKTNAGFGDSTQIGLSREGWRLMVISILYRLDISSDVEIRDWVQELKIQIADCILLASGKKSGGKLRLLNSVANNIKKRTNYPSKNAIHTVVLPDEVISNVRTIHTAKGLERDAVLLIAATPQQFSTWVHTSKSDIQKNEEARIGFVAFSRSKKLLCIATDSLTREKRLWLHEVPNVTVIDIADAKGNKLLF